MADPAAGRDDYGQPRTLRLHLWWTLVLVLAALGGAGLADSILYCRTKIYPLGLPNGVSHVLTVLAVLASMLFGIPIKRIRTSSAFSHAM